jgi:proteasome lid subunit RPN8/RPN11
MMNDATANSQETCTAPRTLEIPADIHDAMIAHCLRESPLEGCGVLGGTAARVLSIHPLRNLAASETRYDGDPAELVQAFRWLRERNLEILAIYHSHPKGKAVPSAVDRRRNYWGPMPHLIVGLLRDPPEVRVWRLSADSQQELPWTLVEPAGEATRALHHTANPD